MAYFYNMLDTCLREEKDDKNKYEEKEEKEKYDQDFINQLELSYQIYGKRFTLDRKINYFLRIVSNKPKLYSTDKK